MEMTSQQGRASFFLMTKNWIFNRCAIRISWNVLWTALKSLARNMELSTLQRSYLGGGGAESQLQIQCFVKLFVWCQRNLRVSFLCVQIRDSVSNALSKKLLYCNIVILMWRMWTSTRKVWRCCWVGFGQPRDPELPLVAMIQSYLSSLVSSVMSHLHYRHHRFESAVLGTFFIKVMVKTFQIWLV